MQNNHDHLHINATLAEAQHPNVNVTRYVSSRAARSDVRVSLEFIPSDKSWLGTRNGPTQIDLGIDRYARNSSTGVDSH